MAPAPVTPPPPAPPVVPTPYVPGTGSLQISQSMLNTMPQGNSATATVVLESGAPVLELSTPITVANPIGSFVGGGTGNKTIVGLDGFNGLKLSDLTGVELDAKLLTGGTSNFYMNFLVDVDCVLNEDPATLSLAGIRTSRRILVWIPGAGTLLPNGYTRYSVAAADSQWLVVGATPAVGLGVNPSGPATPLSAWTGGSAACLADGISGDGGLPRNASIPACVTGAALPTTALAQCSLPSKAAMVVLGDSGNLIAKQWRVQRVKVANREVTFQ